MSDTKSETTFKHRNIIDDILDLGLMALMVAWYFTGVDLDKETLAMIGGIGASARAALRRILVKLWGPKLGIDPAKLPDELKPESEESAPSETTTEAPEEEAPADEEEAG